MDADVTARHVSGDSTPAATHAMEALRQTVVAGEPAVHDDTPALLRAAANTLLDLQFKTWDFGDSVAFEAMIEASRRLDDPSWERFAHGWGRAWATRSRPFTGLDCTAPGRALVHIADRHHDDQLLQALTSLAGHLRTRPELDGVYETWDSSPLLSPYGSPPMTSRDRALLADPPPGVFLDCLHFDPPFFTALGRLTGDDDLFRKGVDQARGYVRLLRKPDGLFDHFVLRGIPGTFGPGWGRGQGWAALGLLATVTELRARQEQPGGLGFADDARILTDAAATLLERMAELQRPDGHWAAVVDREDSGEEYSTAAFMAAAMTQALDADIGDRAKLRSSARSARAAVLRSLDRQCRLGEVSAAVYASTHPAHYAAVPRNYVVPWGQGPALLALLAQP